MRFYIKQTDKLLIIICLFFCHCVFPQCINDYYYVNINDTIEINPKKNDTLISCYFSPINIITNPLNGKVILNNNIIKYFPNKDFIGRDSLKYCIICNGIPYSAWIYLVIVSLPDNVFEVECTTQPLGNEFEIKKLFSFSGVNSMSTPMIADMDGDSVPEILACVNTSESPYFSSGFFVLNGKTGSLKYTLSTVKYETHGQAITIADVDHDKRAELFIMGFDMYVYCYNYNGGIRWKSSTIVDKKYLLSTADINNDGIAELVCGPYIFNATNGTLLLHFTMQSNGQGFGSPHNYHCYPPSRAGREYYMYALADIDYDGTLEMCAGNCIYKITITNSNGTTGNSAILLRQAETNSNITYYDGQTIILDFDNDGDVDICVLAKSKNLTNNTFNNYVWDGQTSKIIGYNVIVEENWGGQSIPFVGDLDGNGYPEIVFSSTNKMYALTYDSLSPGKIKLMHAYAPFNETAGFTIFDFNQDGKNEIVFRNTSQLFIADGVTLKNLCTPITSYSGTITEYPVVADVDADGVAEIIITHSDQPWNNYNSSGFVTVFASTKNNVWSSARKVWNQWSYNSININEDLTVPQYQYNLATKFPNGKKIFNSFLHQMPLVNSDGDLYISIADVAVLKDYIEIQNSCDSIQINILFENKGGVALKAPYYLTVYKDNYKGTILYIDTIYKSLNRNQRDSIKITIKNKLSLFENFVFVVNDNGKGVAQSGGQQEECDTLNNFYILPSSILYRKDTVEYYDTIHEKEVYNKNGFYIPSDSTNYISIEKHKLFSNSNGCDSLVILHLHVIMDSLFVTINLNPKIICQYDSSILSIVSIIGGEGKFTFLWTPSESLNSNKDSIVVSKSLKTTKYSLLVIDEHGRKGNAYIELIVNPIPKIELGDDIGICNDSMYPILLTPCIENYIFKWNTGEESRCIQVNRPGKYIINAWNEYNCIARDSVNVVNVNNLYAKIISLNDFCDKNNTILEVETNANHYLWNTNDTTQSILVHKPGEYFVKAIELGCYAYDFYIVDSCFIRLFLPNVITPSDANGINDYFSLLLPNGYEIDNFKITFIDRWGNIIYRSNDIKFKWYGTTLNGRIGVNMIFNYRIEFEKNGKKYVFNDFVLVL